MNLGEVAARLRPRTSWEAVDLGVALGRRFFKSIAAAWLVWVLPVAAICAAFAATTTYFWLPLLVVWWLKPLYDRVALLVLSRAFFGDTPTIKQSARYIGRSWWSRSALADITWRRLSPFRGMTTLVRELEHLGGSAARSRAKVLLRRHVLKPIYCMLVVGLATEVIFVGACGALVHLLIPQTLQFDLFAQLGSLTNLDANAPEVETMIFVTYFVAMSVVEIFYAAASFGLYINRRVRLEGWDIELVFKNLARRLTSQARSVGHTAAAVGLIAAVAIGVSAQPVAAQPQTADPSAASRRQPLNPGGRPAVGGRSEPSSRAQTEVADILEAPEFGTTSTEKQWKMRDDLFDDDQDDHDGDAIGSKVSSTVGRIVQVVMWVLAGGAVAAAVMYFVKRANRVSIGRGSEPSSANAQVAGEVAEQPPPALPADIVDTAVDHWNRSEYADSLSVLYRGTIRGLAAHYRIEINPNLTARECTNAVGQAGGPADYVAELAAAWTATVYADRRICDERARQLFRAWKSHFRSGRPG